MNKIKLTLATLAAIGSLGLASAQAVNVLSSPRASADTLPTASGSGCCKAPKVQKEAKSCHDTGAAAATAKDCCKDKSAECCKEQKACCKKQERDCCKK